MAIKDMLFAFGIPMKNPARHKHVTNIGILDVIAGHMTERQKIAVRKKLTVTTLPYLPLNILSAIIGVTSEPNMNENTRRPIIRPETIVPRSRPAGGGTAMCPGVRSWYPCMTHESAKVERNVIQKADSLNTLLKSLSTSAFVT